MRQGGYNRYHCYRYSSIFDLESFFFFDNAYQIESVVVVFGSESPLNNELACRCTCFQAALHYYRWQCQPYLMMCLVYKLRERCSCHPVPES